MTRTYYFIGGLAALTFAVLVQSGNLIRTSASATPSRSVAANPATTPTVAPDARAEAIDELASWPIAATRK